MRPRSPWLARQIADAQRCAVEGVCSRCGAVVLVGDDDDRVALRVAVDALPISRAYEQAAIETGRHTFDLVPMRGGRAALHARYSWHVQSDRPARYPIHVEHRCQRGVNHRED